MNTTQAMPALGDVVTGRDVTMQTVETGPVVELREVRSIFGHPYTVIVIDAGEYSNGATRLAIIDR